MNNLIIDRSQLVSAIIPASPGYGTIVPFEDIPNISKGNVLLYGIEVYSSAQAAFSPEGLEVISVNDVPNVNLTLVTVNNNDKQLENIPYYNLIRSNNGGFITLLNNIQIDLTKCYLTILDGGTFQQNQAFLINLYFKFTDNFK